MNENKRQNAMIATTSVNEEGKTVLFYIPLNLDFSVVELFLKEGGCTNKQAVYFELDTDEETFWEDSWKSLVEEEGAVEQ